jgi:hypothetical protein
MKHILLGALLLAYFFLPAQDYRPFLPGRLHYFSATGPDFSVRVDSAGLVGADSAFWMNRIIGTACNPPGTFRHYFKDGFEGRMGDHFIAGADGAFRIVSQPGDTLTLHTRLPLATPWPFLTGTALTAELQSRSATTTFGVADSVLDIAVSDGNHYTLSQHFGLLDGINFSGYFSIHAAVPCTLVRAPNLPPTLNEYVTWQPGDAFTYVKDRGMQLGKFNNYTVRDRWTNAAGDSLWLEVNNQFTLTIPPNMDTIAYPTVVDTLLYTDGLPALARLATGELDSTLQPIRIAHSWDYATSFGGEIRLRYDNYQFSSPDFWVDSCGYYSIIAPPCDDPYPGQMVEEFGIVRYVYSIGATITLCVTDVGEMLCYKRATDSIVCPAWLELATGIEEVGIKGELRIAASASGQPSLLWDGLNPGLYRLQLCDLQGRVLSDQSLQLDASGSQAIDLPGAAGLYLLHVEDLAGGGNWIARLPKFSH